MHRPQIHSVAVSTIQRTEMHTCTYTAQTQLTQNLNKEYNYAEAFIHYYSCTVASYAMNTVTIHYRM